MLYKIIVRGRCRAALKMVPNRLIFGDAFDRPGTSEALSFENKQSPSLERGWEGNCDCTSKTAPSDDEASAFYLTLFGSGSSGLGYRFKVL